MFSLVSGDCFVYGCGVLGVYATIGEGGVAEEMVCAFPHYLPLPFPLLPSSALRFRGWETNLLC